MANGRQQKKHKRPVAFFAFPRNGQRWVCTQPGLNRKWGRGYNGRAHFIPGKIKRNKLGRPSSWQRPSQQTHNRNSTERREAAKTGRTSSTPTSQTQFPSPFFPTPHTISLTLRVKIVEEKKNNESKNLSMGKINSIVAAKHINPYTINTWRDIHTKNMG